VISDAKDEMHLSCPFTPNNHLSTLNDRIITENDHLITICNQLIIINISGRGKITIIM